MNRDVMITEREITISRATRNSTFVFGALPIEKNTKNNARVLEWVFFVLDMPHEPLSKIWNLDTKTNGKADKLWNIFLKTTKITIF